jgi:hypothetical protein
MAYLRIHQLILAAATLFLFTASSAAPQGVEENPTAAGVGTKSHSKKKTKPPVTNPASVSPGAQGSNPTPPQHSGNAAAVGGTSGPAIPQVGVVKPVK